MARFRGLDILGAGPGAGAAKRGDVTQRVPQPKAPKGPLAAAGRVPLVVAKPTPRQSPHVASWKASAASLAKAKAAVDRADRKARSYSPMRSRETASRVHGIMLGAGPLTPKAKQAQARFAAASAATAAAARQTAAAVKQAREAMARLAAARSKAQPLYAKITARPGKPTRITGIDMLGIDELPLALEILGDDPADTGNEGDTVQPAQSGGIDPTQYGLPPLQPLYTDLGGSNPDPNLVPMPQRDVPLTAQEAAVVWTYDVPLPEDAVDATSLGLTVDRAALSWNLVFGDGKNGIAWHGDGKFWQESGGEFLPAEKAAEYYLSTEILDIDNWSAGFFLSIRNQWGPIIGGPGTPMANAQAQIPPSYVYPSRFGKRIKYSQGSSDSSNGPGPGGFFWQGPHAPSVITAPYDMQIAALNKKTLDADNAAITAQNAALIQEARQLAEAAAKADAEGAIVEKRQQQQSAALDLQAAALQLQQATTQEQQARAQATVEEAAAKYIAAHPEEAFAPEAGEAPAEEQAAEDFAQDASDMAADFGQGFDAGDEG